MEKEVALESLKNTINLEGLTIHVRVWMNFTQCGLQSTREAFDKSRRNNKWLFKTKAGHVCGEQRKIQLQFDYSRSTHIHWDKIALN